MILKGAKRGGAMQMANHLLNGEQNEQITVHAVSGFMADDVTGALMESYGIARGTQCRQFLFSLSLNPPQDESVPVPVFEDAAARAAEKLGLADQPFVMVFHEKQGRRHAHVVWSRIDAEQMKAIDQAFYKNRLKEISRSIYLEQDWTLPKGFIDNNRKSPLNFTRAEWQQAQRIGRKAADIKAELQEAWALSDNRASFEAALQSRGYALARGDRRGVVAVDLHGEVYSLSRQLGRPTKDLEARLGVAKTLPSLTHAQTRQAKQLKPLFERYLADLHQTHQHARVPLLKQARALQTRHRAERHQLREQQTQRQQREHHTRQARLRRGVGGAWDRLSGRYTKTRRRNERETWQSLQRDQQQRDRLIEQQLRERLVLQQKMEALHTTHERERLDLIRDLDQMRAFNDTALPESLQHDAEWQHEQGEHTDLESIYEPDQESDHER